MSKSYIEIDADSWADASGIETTVFIGDSCEPCFVHFDSYEELVDKELNAHTVAGKLSGSNLEKAEGLVVALEEAAVYARKRVEELSDGNNTLRNSGSTGRFRLR